MKMIINTQKTKMNELKPSELHYQVGNIIRIIKEPKFAKKFGFTLNSEHVIVTPPKNGINSAIAVWIKDKNGMKVELPFYNWIWTGRTVKIKGNRIKRKRTK